MTNLASNIELMKQAKERNSNRNNGSDVNNYTTSPPPYTPITREYIFKSMTRACLESENVVEIVKSIW